MIEQNEITKMFDTNELNRLQRCAKNKDKKEILKWGQDFERRIAQFYMKEYKDYYLKLYEERLKDLDDLEKAEKETEIKLLRKAIKDQQQQIEYLNCIVESDKDNYINKTDINDKIKVLEILQKEFPNNEEIRIRIISYKELLN